MVVKEEIYVIVYVGYEGIDEIVHATTDREEAVRVIKELRKKAEKDPDREPDRYCVMKKGKEGYECACAELGVPPKIRVIY